MIKELRAAYNHSFSEKKYQKFLLDMEQLAGGPIPFRIAETPVFIPSSIKASLVTACNDIIEIIKSPAHLKKSDRAIPERLFVPGNEQKPMWLAFDFAICRNDAGELSPQLIELQGFPSLFFHQHALGLKYREHFTVPEKVSHLFGMGDSGYISHMRKMLLNGHDSRNVILLEVEPEKQNTRIDFKLTRDHTGIRSVCISKLILDNRKLFYEDEGQKIPVHRIYNRVIFDELVRRKDLLCQFHLTENVDVEWAGHPNWFFRISKFTMPFLKNPFVPETRFLNELTHVPNDLENYVLKPLFSFSGSGVLFHVTPGDIDKVTDPENWILQKKVNYEPVILSPDGLVKTEIRMLYSWDPDSQNPELIINMARLSRGEMIGVKYNKNKTWVGGSVGFFEV